MHQDFQSVEIEQAVSADHSDQRLNTLCVLDLFDSPRNEIFDRIVRLIQKILNVEGALVSIIDGHRQWYKSYHGLHTDEVPLEKSFCSYVMASDHAIVVADTHLDVRFKDHSAVLGEPKIRFYASVPLRTQSGLTIGTVCAIDPKPRQLSQRELEILEELAATAMDLIELQQTASEDSLTEALTRRAFRQAMEYEIRKSHRTASPLSLVTLDIDHFKHVNDTYGHNAGDDVLKEIAAICRGHLRANDVFCRMGGEEFAILLPDTSETGAFAFAESLRTAIANRPITCSFGSIAITVSLGCAVLNGGEQNLETLLAEADTALYNAKRAGRNQTQIMNYRDKARQIGERKRQFAAGSINFNNGMDKVPCTIKTIGPDGAGIIVSDAMAIPENFTLSVQSTKYSRKCAIIARHKRNIEVTFCA